MQGIFVTGTDTDVGKTYVATLLATHLVADGINVIPRKPVESGCTRINGKLFPADANALKIASSYPGNLVEVCPFRFEPALSPVRAAQLCHQEISIEQLKSACTDKTENGFVITEGAGGFYSPLAKDGLNADLAAALQLPILLIANDKLGCINQILLTIEAISNRGLKLAAIVLNSKDPQAHADLNNADDLREYTTAPIYTLAHKQNNDRNIAALIKNLKNL